MFDFIHPSICISICKEEPTSFRKQLFKGVGQMEKLSSPHVVSWIQTNVAKENKIGATQNSYLGEKKVSKGMNSSCACLYGNRRFL